MNKIFFTALLSIFSWISFAQSYKGARNEQTAEQKLNEAYCTGLFKTTEGTVLQVADNPSINGYINILDWLNGRVAGLQVYRSHWGTSVPVIRGNVAGVYIDEIPVTLTTLSSLNIYDIAIIKVIKTPFYGGFNGGNGAIAIYTLDGEEDEEEAVTR